MVAVNERYPPSVPDEEHLRTIMELCGVDEDTAAFILAVERGDVDVEEPGVRY